MVLPLLIGGSLLGGWILRSSGVLSENGLIQIGEGVGEVIGGVVQVIPPVIEATVPAIIEGVQGGVMAGKETLEGRLSLFFTSLTVVTLSYVGLRMVKKLTQ